ncbi:MAG: hypothetical protein ACYTXY_21060 [Nostoc sp.]
MSESPTRPPVGGGRMLLLYLDTGDWVLNINSSEQGLDGLNSFLSTKADRTI